MQGANLLRLKALREVERNEYEAALLTLRDLSAFARLERKIHDLGRHRYNLLDWSARLDEKIQDEEFRKKKPRSGMR